MKRIELIDALRGFSLLLILLIHSYGNFGVNAPAEFTLVNSEKINLLTDKFIFYFIVNKAFAIFSIMFGLSFFIQLKRSSDKDINFSLFFLKRLFILFLIGYVHALFYRGDILTKYAIIGIPLIFINRLNSKTLLVIAIISLLQIPQIVQLIYSWKGIPLPFTFADNPGLWERMDHITAYGSLGELISVNMGEAFYENWRLNFMSGRLLMIFGYFLIGLLLGRSRVLENVKSNFKNVIYFFAASTGMFIVLMAIKLKADVFIDPATEAGMQVINLLDNYMSIMMVVIMFSGFIIIYQLQLLRYLLKVFIPIGKMSLTIYFTQSLIGITLFFGFGFALYKYASPTFSVLIAIGIFLIQTIFAYVWLKYNRYGPLEYIWRFLAYSSFRVPLRKIESIFSR